MPNSKQESLSSAENAEERGLDGPAPGGNSLAQFLKILGPGLITGASDDDPSGIGTYAMAGASLGYATLWTAPVTFPLMAGVQLICARIGLISGCGLAGVLRRHYSAWVIYPAIICLLVANTINAAADIQAIAAGINLLVPIPILWLTAPIAIAILAVQIWGSYRFIAKTFRWLTLSLFAYFGAAFLAHPKWGEVIRGTLIPTFEFSGSFIAMFVALLGTTISPYLFFWQASQEVEEQKSKQNKKHGQPEPATQQELKFAAWDVNTGMLLSNLVMYFIILATAATLHESGKNHIDTATQAAEALRPIAGDTAYVLMALGLIGTGMLAVPILTGSAAYSVAEIAGWKCGLDEKPHQAKGFYWVLTAATAVALLLDFVGIKPMDALFWTAVMNGLLSPPILIVVMLVSNNRKVMGQRTNGRWLNLLGWTTTVVMTLAAIALFATWGK